MGIDIYARYHGQSAEERASQVTEFLSATAGKVGYLREAYHGEPYATRYLVHEAFITGQADIPAVTLRGRLPEALRLTEIRERQIYHETDPKEIEAVLDSFRAFDRRFSTRLAREILSPDPNRVTRLV
jgi:hypothetical protein